MMKNASSKALFLSPFSHLETAERATVNNCKICTSEFHFFMITTILTPYYFLSYYMYLFEITVHVVFFLRKIYFFRGGLPPIESASSRRMSSVDDADPSCVAGSIVQIDHRTPEEDSIDLDYEEDAFSGMPTEENKSDNTEKPPDDEKEDGELEDGEITSSDDEPAPVAVKKASSSPKMLPKANLSSIKEFRSRLSKVPVEKPGETAWERGLREAREAMRRAHKVREEPDFEVKRLVAAPTVRKNSRNNTDSDNSLSPIPRRRNTSRSSSPKTIPSLMDLRTSPPPRRVPPKESPYRRRSVSPCGFVRPITRASPSYNSPSPHNRRSPTPKSYRKSRYLGPQVIYPHGRPCPKRDPERDRDRKDRSRQENSVRRKDYQEQPRRREESVRAKSREESVRAKSRDDWDGKKNKKTVKISTSPISSDSDLSQKLYKKDVKHNRSDLSGVNDPWARKKKGKSDKLFDRKSRKSSTSSSNSSDSKSTFTGRHKNRSSSSSSSASEKSSDERRKYSKKTTSPRNDLKRSRVSKNEVTSRERNPVEEFFTKKRSDLPAAFKKRARRKSSSDSEDDKLIKGIEAISGSESDKSSSSSSSSKSSLARSVSPDVPFKFRQKEKSPSPISEDSTGVPTPPPPPPKLEDISPPPPPGSPPPKKSKSNKDSKDRSLRKQKLMQQLREVEDELEKRRTVRLETAH